MGSDGWDPAEVRGRRGGVRMSGCLRMVWVVGLVLVLGFVMGCLVRVCRGRWGVAVNYERVWR